MEVEDPLSVSLIKQENESLEDDQTAVTVDGTLFIDDSLTEVKTEPEFFDVPEKDVKYSCKSVEGEEDPLSCGIECRKKLQEESGDESNKNYYKELESNAEEKTFMCAECESSFAFLGHLKTHMKMHLKEKSLACSVCKSTFPTPSLLKRHMRTHTGEKPFTCPECGKSCSQSHHLKTHMKTHSGEKPFACPKCQKSFLLSRYLKRHMVSHSGEKPFTCSECLGSFSNSDILKRHMRTHTGEKPFTCLLTSYKLCEVESF
ncbi:gastrula zinc finger protein XlCGF7.1-like [Macrobrachium rosenbergii]|uniref:gastrula zinc finger protein XlCGF7.1-like n=1 Tax=Macrobrachium rosenbergii TaxID=79674 RepID=UPI0034D4353B